MLKTGLNEQRENCQKIQKECRDIINSIKDVNDAREKERKEMQKKLEEVENQYKGFWGFFKRIGRAVVGAVVTLVGVVALPFTNKVFDLGIDLITFNDPEKYVYQNNLNDLDDSDHLYKDAEEMMEKISEGLEDLDKNGIGKVITEANKFLPPI